ncbi:DUF1801 domain-containing protein [Prauserella oleivorans]|uniref:DUF1801 domain-containing protein n=1 Tax=Prauserella oleivorans TaxID=1478153 RepID=A0ABW5WEH6_9PSEU
MATNTTVEDYLAALPEPLADAGKAMLALIRDALPGANEAMWHGHPVWSAGDAPGKQPICLLKGYKAHLAFSLWRGQAVPDPSGRLEPGAREMAGVKLRGADDVDEAVFSGWLREARALG